MNNNSISAPGLPPPPPPPESSAGGSGDTGVIGAGQALAYHQADFSVPHGERVGIFRRLFPGFEPDGAVLDLGCGSGDVLFRFARAFPQARFTGVDGAPAMLELAAAHPQQAALRLGALDLAIANLLGSNLFNLVVLAVDDAAYLRGPLLADAAPVHVGTAVAAMVMTGLVMIGLVMRPQGRALRVLSWISVGLLATYLLNAALIFLHGGG